MTANVAPRSSRAHEQHPPLSDGQRLRIAELADEGCSAREIGRRLGVNASTVTKHARRMGVVFDRAQTERATAARIADAKAKRTETALRLLALANSELDRLTRPYRAHAFVGGKEPTYLEHVLPQPDAAARLAIARAAATLLDKHRILTELDTDNDGLAQAKSLLGQLHEGLKTIAGEIDDTETGTQP